MSITRVRYNGAMRNNGWYIPYWRKPKKKGRQERPGTQEVERSDEQLEAVRQRWVERYRRTARSLRLLGLSVGSNRGDVQERYQAVRGSDSQSARDLEDAYRHLIRVLPVQERRKRRNQPVLVPSASGPPDASGASFQSEAPEGVQSEAPEGFQAGSPVVPVSAEESGALPVISDAGDIGGGDEVVNTLDIVSPDHTRAEPDTHTANMFPSGDAPTADRDGDTS